MNTLEDKAIAALDKQLKDGYQGYYGKKWIRMSKQSYRNKVASVRAFCRENKHLFDLNDLDYIVITILMSKKTDNTKIRLIQMFRSISKNKKIKSEAIQKVYFSLTSKVYGDKQLKKNIPCNPSEDFILENISLIKLRQRIDYVSSNRMNVLYTLLIALDATPRLDYSTLRYIDKRYHDTGKCNYILINDNEAKIILNLYKTGHKYGKWEIHLNQIIKRQVLKCINKYNIQLNGLLFVNSRKKQFPSNKFSEYVVRCIKQKCKYKITMNTLRKLKERDLFHMNEYHMDKSYAEKEEYVIENFKHDLKTAMLWYNKKTNNRKDSSQLASDT